MSEAMNPVDRAKAKIKELGGASSEEPVAATTEPTAEQPTASSDPAQQATGEQAQPGTTTTEQQQPPKEGTSEDFRHKYLTLQGHHRQALDKITGLNDELETLKTTVAELKEGGQATDPLPDGASEEEIARHLQALQEDYGDSFQAALSGYVDGRINALEKTINSLLDQRLGEVESHVDDVAAETVNARSDKFRADLTSIVPDWEETYNDTFVGWLETTTEDMSGRSYLELFREANNAWDLARVAKFFTTYKQATGQQQQPGTAPQAAAQQAAADPREQLLSPGTGSPTGQAPPSDQGGQAKVLKWSEVQSFYKDAQTGVYRGREEEMNQILAEINLANHEGRIVNG